MHRKSKKSYRREFKINDNKINNNFSATLNSPTPGWLLYSDLLSSNLPLLHELLPGWWEYILLRNNCTPLVSCSQGHAAALFEKVTPLFDTMGHLSLSHSSLLMMKSCFKQLSRYKWRITIFQNLKLKYKIYLNTCKYIKGTVIQIEKALKNDCLRVSKIS